MKGWMEQGPKTKEKFLVTGTRTASHAYSGFKGLCASLGASTLAAAFGSCSAALST